MLDIEQHLREAMEALVAIADGYPVRGEADRFVIVENPKFREDDGSDPNICIDTFELRDAARKKADTIASLRSKLEEAEGALEPFSKYAGPLFERNFNDPDTIIEITAADGGLAALHARDFFEARRTLSSLREADHA